VGKELKRVVRIDAFVWQQTSCTTSKLRCALLHCLLACALAETHASFHPQFAGTMAYAAECSVDLMFGFELSQDDLVSSLLAIERTARAANPAAFDDDNDPTNDGILAMLQGELNDETYIDISGEYTRMLHVICTRLFADRCYRAPGEDVASLSSPVDLQLVTPAGDAPLDFALPETHAAVHAIFAELGVESVIADTALSYLISPSPASLVRVRFVQTTSRDRGNQSIKRYFIALDASVFPWPSYCGDGGMQNSVYAIDADAVPLVGIAVLKQLIADVGITTTRAEPGWMLLCTAGEP
jgi:hypothetical protein